MPLRASHADALAAALADTQTPWGASRWAELQRCPRAHHLHYVEGVNNRRRPDDAETWDTDDASYLEVGQLCHSVLHFVQEAVIDGRDGAQWGDVLAEAQRRNADLGASYEAERLMGAYWAHWGLDNAGWPDGARILGVEVPLTSTLGGRPYTARADTLLQVADEVVIVDTKTRGRGIPDERERYAKGLATRPQFLGLSWLVASGGMANGCCGQTPSGIWVNAIIKTKVPKFDRLMVRPTTAAIDAWASNHIALASMGGDALPVVANYSACAPEVGARCRYFEWCHGSDASRERHYEIRPPKGATPEGEKEAA